jgi:hypothetical protein
MTTTRTAASISDYLRNSYAGLGTVDIGVRMSLVNAELFAARHGTTVAGLGLTVEDDMVDTLALVRALGY